MGTAPPRAIQVRRISGRKILRFFLLPLKKNVAKKKMMQSLMLVLLAVAGSQAAKLTATGVDLEPIFLFLDDDGENGVDATELKALTTTGDSDGKIDADNSGGISLQEFFD